MYYVRYVKGCYFLHLFCSNGAFCEVILWVFVAVDELIGEVYFYLYYFFVSVYVLCYVCVYVELFEIFGKKCIRNSVC